MRFLWLVTTSFKASAGVLSPKFIGFFTPVLDNYKAVLSEARFLDRYEVKEAAYVNGFKKITSFIRVTLPLAVGHG